LSAKCQNKCVHKFSEDERKDIFTSFWGLNSIQRQRDFIISCAIEIPIKRVRAKHGLSRRSITYEYFLSYNSESKKVCLPFLLKTLNVSQKFVRYTLQNKTNIDISPNDRRGKGRPPNKVAIEI